MVRLAFPRAQVRRCITLAVSADMSACSKIIVDNMAYARTVQVMGYRTSATTTDLSSVLPEEIEAEVKEAAEISMGTEVRPARSQLLQLID